MKKRIFSMLVAICLVLSMIPTVSGSAFASTTYVSDSDVTYEADGGNIYFDASTGTITGCDTSVTEAVIPSEINGVAVTKIGDNVFNNMESLKKVEIPKSVTAIGNAAFCMSALTSITIPSSVKGIGEYAFAHCGLITSIELPNGTTTVGEDAFYNCSSLKSIEMPASVTSIAANAFSGCSNLQYIVGKKGSYAEQYANENNIPFVATHTHCVCGAEHKNIGDHTAENSITFTAWTDELAEEQNGEGKTAANSLPSVAGNYYLTKDVTLAYTWHPVGKTTLCLDGKNIVLTSDAAYEGISIGTRNNDIPENIYFTLTDCRTTQGKIKGDENSVLYGAVNVINNSRFDMFGGNIEGNEKEKDNNTYAVRISSHEDDFVRKFNMYGGSISYFGTGVFSCSVFQMYDGSINNCSLGVLNHENATFSMSGGKIENNRSAAEGISAVNNKGTFNMTGGYIKGNSSAHEYEEQETIIRAICNFGTFNMTGGYITENNAEWLIYIGGDNASFIFSGGRIDNNHCSTQNEPINTCVIRNDIGTFDIKGGRIADNDSSYCIIENDGKSCSMSSGIIENNAADSCVIMNKKSFNMTGGEITENSCENDVQCVVYNNGNHGNYFEMTGGSITNNTGTGLVTCNNTVIGGSAKITGNKLSDGSNNNLSIHTGTTISVTPLSNDARIGISADIGVFTSNAAREYIDRFFSDYPYCEIAADTEGKLKLQSKSGTETPNNVKAPTAVAVYGQKLNELTLENPSVNMDGTWVWMDETQSVGNASTTAKIFYAKFIPADADKYLPVEGIPVSVTVNPKPLTNDMLRMDSETKKYNGSAIEADFTVSDGEIPLVKDEDFNVDYSNNVNAGQATVNVTGIGNYSGTVTKHFEIEAADIKAWKDFVELEYTQVKYNGSAKTPAVTISGLTENVDFTVSYANNIEEGTAVVTISGIGNYTGEIQASFEILENVLCTVSGTAISWNNTDDAVYLLYAGTTADSVIRTEWKDNSYGTSENVLNKDCTKGDVSANADTKRWNQTFSFSGVSEGTYKLAILKPGHGIWIETITVENNEISGKNIELYKMGDVNKNGSVTNLDISWVLQYKAGKREFTDEQLILADVNINGSVTNLDISWMLQYKAGKRDEKYNLISAV